MKIYFVQTKKLHKFTDLEIMVYRTDIYLSSEEIALYEDADVIQKGIYNLDDTFIEQAKRFAQKKLKATKDTLTRGCDKLEKAIRLAYLRDYANSMN